MDPTRVMSSAALTVAVATMFAPPVMGWMQAPASRPGARLEVSVAQPEALLLRTSRVAPAFCAPEPTDAANRARAAAVFAAMGSPAGTMSTLSR
jgi:hypothetical protein